MRIYNHMPARRLAPFGATRGFTTAPYPSSGSGVTSSTTAASSS